MQQKKKFRKNRIKNMKQKLHFFLLVLKQKLMKKSVGKCIKMDIEIDGNIWILGLKVSTLDGFAGLLEFPCMH